MTYNFNQYFYYFYELTNNGLILRRTFKNYVELIEFLAKSQYGQKEKQDGKNVFNNKYLDGVNLTLNDTYNYVDWHGNSQYYLRPYVFYNQDLAIVDIRNFYEDIYEMAIFLTNRKYSYKDSWHEKIYKGHIFRASPVPYTSKRRSGSCRNIKCGRIIRDLKNPENQEFIRKKRYYGILEPYFDRPFKRETKCWKEQTKKRHQWEKHKK